MVGEEQVRDLNAQDLPSALRRTPGVTISRYNPVGSFGGAEGGAIFVRGLGSSRPGGEMKTYVDGVPLMMGVFNHPLMDILPVDEAGSIEVVKGAQPHRFGNTFSAVNLVPKRMTEQGQMARLSAQGGSFDTWAQTLDEGEHHGHRLRVPAGLPHAGLRRYGGPRLELVAGGRPRSDATDPQRAFFDARAVR